MPKSGVKGKSWYRLEAPDMFNNKELGEVLGATEESIVGRKVEKGATDLVSGSNKYYFTVFLKVDRVENGVGKCKFIGHMCSRDFISRMIRRRSKRVDSRTKVTTSDGVDVVVKTVCATINSVGASKQTGIRKKIEKVLEEEASDMTLEEFVNSIFSGKVQSNLKENCDEVYPLRQIEIRKTEVEE